MVEPFNHCYAFGCKQVLVQTRTFKLVNSFNAVKVYVKKRPFAAGVLMH